MSDSNTDDWKRVSVDESCPLCDSDIVVMEYEALYVAGEENPVRSIRKGLKCDSCGLGYFWKPGLKEQTPDDPLGEVKDSE